MMSSMSTRCPRFISAAHSCVTGGDNMGKNCKADPLSISLVTLFALKCAKMTNTKNKFAHIIFMNWQRSGASLSNPRVCGECGANTCSSSRYDFISEALAEVVMIEQLEAAILVIRTLRLLEALIVPLLV